MTIRRLLAAVAALMVGGVGAVSPASAQITTTITQPKPSQQAQVVAARREAAAQDSAARVTLTDMKQWVDSAANALALRPDTAGAPAVTGVAAPQPPATRTDTAVAAPPRQQSRAAQPEFRDGARAPDTATPLPSIAVAGGLLIAIGVLMRRRATAAVRARR